MDTPSIAQAFSAEREAVQRIKDANERVNREERTANDTITEIRDKFHKQYESEGIKQEAILENQKMKGYEQIREQQRAQQSDLRKVRREGQVALDQIKDHNRDQLIFAERDGTGKVNDLQNQIHHTLEDLHAQEVLQEAEIKDKNDLRLKQIQDSGDDAIKKLTEANQKDMQRIRDSYQTQIERAQDLLEKKFETTTKTNNEIMKTISHAANKGIETIRRENASKIAAYTSKQQDPFYRLIEINARFEDSGDHFTLTATIPKYEQQNVTATVSGNNLIISGRRRNDERQDLGGGHYESSASYQSFQESFPLSWPVDASRLSREFEGDQVIIRVPKKNEFALNLKK